MCWHSYAKSSMQSAHMSAHSLLFAGPQGSLMFRNSGGLSTALNANEVAGTQGDASAAESRTERGEIAIAILPTSTCAYCMHELIDSRQVGVPPKGVSAISCMLQLTVPCQWQCIRCASAFWPARSHS
jgi:hypothetical protein